MARKAIQIEERPPLGIGIALSIQHLFAMFGASVLVPFLFEINPAVVLFMNGIGTLLFILITKGKAPAFLGSSFAFLAPTFAIFSAGGSYANALGGFVAVGIAFCIVAIIVKFVGTDWINIAMPPAAMGPVVALIGLELASVAASTAGIAGIEKVDPRNLIVFGVTLGVAVFGSVLFRKFFAIIPILIAIIAGYVSALIVDATWTLSGDMTTILNYDAFSKMDSIFSVPNFQTPDWNMSAIFTMLPAVLVVVAEHIGHQLVTSKIVDRDLIKEPGLHKTLFSDGFSTALSGMCGSVPTTTYGENIGVMAITKVYSVWVIGGAAVLSIVIAFVTPISLAIQTIPGAVIGGVSFLLYGMIATSGIRLLVDSKVDYAKSKNLVLTSVVIITGLSGVAINLGDAIQLKGMALSAIVAIVLSLIFWGAEKLHLTNDEEETENN